MVAVAYWSGGGLGLEFASREGHLLAVAGRSGAPPMVGRARELESRPNEASPT